MPYLATDALATDAQKQLDAFKAALGPVGAGLLAAFPPARPAGLEGPSSVAAAGGAPLASADVAPSDASGAASDQLPTPPADAAAFRDFVAANPLRVSAWRPPAGLGSGAASPDQAPNQDVTAASGSSPFLDYVAANPLRVAGWQPPPSGIAPGAPTLAPGVPSAGGATPETGAPAASPDFNPLDPRTWGAAPDLAARAVGLGRPSPASPLTTPVGPASPTLADLAALVPSIPGQVGRAATATGRGLMDLNADQWQQAAATFDQTANRIDTTPRGPLGPALAAANRQFLADVADQDVVTDPSDPRYRDPENERKLIAQVGSAVMGVGGGDLGAAPKTADEAIQVARDAWTRVASIADSLGVDTAGHQQYLRDYLPTATTPAETIGGSTDMLADAVGRIRDAVGRQVEPLQAQLDAYKETALPELARWGRAFLDPNGSFKENIPLSLWQRVTGDTRTLAPNALAKRGGTVYVKPEYAADEFFQTGEAVGRFGKQFDTLSDFQRAMADAVQKDTAMRSAAAQITARVADESAATRAYHAALPDEAMLATPTAASPTATPPAIGNAGRVGFQPPLTPGRAVSPGGVGGPITGQQIASAAMTPPPATLPPGAALARVQGMLREGAPTAPTGALAPGPVESFRRGIVRALTDNRVDLAMLQQTAAREAGRPLGADEMVTELSRLNPDGAADVALQRGLAPALRSVGQDREALSSYLIATGNQDVAVATGNVDRAFSGGVTASDSPQILADLRAQLGPQRFAAVQDAAGRVNAFARSLLQRKVDAGLISQPLADALTARFPNYTPTRILDYLDQSASGPGGRSLSVRDAGLRSLTDEGTTAAREDPLASLVRSAYQTEAVARKNETFGALVKLRDLSPTLRGAIRPVPDDFAGTVAERPVTGFVAGQRVTYAMPRDLAELIQGQPTAPIPVLSTAMGVVRGLLASRNPLFVPTHGMITAGPYVLRTLTREAGPGLAGQLTAARNLPRVIGALADAYVDAFRGLPTGEYGPATTRYLEAGGGMFGTFNPSPTGARLAVADLARPNVFAVQSAGDAARMVGDLLTGRPVESVINRVDLAPRVAAFNLAQRRGANVTQAVSEGRSSTIDFSQGGTVAKLINAVVPFFNVAMQGAAQPARMIRENPTAAFATLVSTLAAPTVAIEAWNRSDPQRARDYADVPNFYKDSGLVVMLPGQAPVDAPGNRRPQFVYVPTREFSPFVTLTREAAGRAMGADPRAWGSLLGGAVAGISPVPAESAGAAVGRLVPGGPLLTTPIELALNKRFQTGGAVVSRAADQGAGAVARGIGALSGGRVAPSGVQYTIEAAGGPGQLVGSIGRPTSAGSGAPQDVPLLGPVVSRFVKGGIGQQLQDARTLGLPPATADLLRQGGVTYTPGPVGDHIGKVPLTRDERSRYQDLANAYRAQLLAADVRDPGWARATPAQRQKVVRADVTAADKRAAGEVLRALGPVEEKARVLRQQATAAGP